MMTGRSGWVSRMRRSSSTPSVSGQPHVEHRDVGRLLLELLERLGAGGGEDQIVSRLERALVAESERGLVLDDQDAPAALCLRHASYSATRCPERRPAE